jgi:hypothetical protein
MSLSQRAQGGAGRPIVKTPLWSMTLPADLTPLSFFVITALGLFGVLALEMQHTAQSPWVRVGLLGPPYVLLAYVIRSVVGLVRSGSLAQSQRKASGPASRGMFRSGGRSDKISTAAAPPRLRRAGPHPPSVTARATTAEERCRKAS